MALQTKLEKQCCKYRIGLLSHAMNINRKEKTLTGRKECYLKTEVLICNKDEQIHNTMNLKFYTIFIKGITLINARRNYEISQ